MKRVVAVLFLMAALGGCATAPAPIEVTYVTRPPRDREAEIAAFWAARAKPAPAQAADFSKPDIWAYREKWRVIYEQQAFTDAVRSEGETHPYFR